jgi:hypothetical protein
MITINKSFFEQCVATATDATADVFEMVEPNFDTEIEYLEDFVLGFSLKHLDNEDLVFLCKRFICFNAFAKLIPQMDLILTSTGFGVVRTENLAPASPERVSNLLRAISDAAADALDKLLFYLVKSQPSEWGTKAQAITWVDSVIYTGLQLSVYGIRERTHRSELTTLRPKIMEAEDMVMHLLSPELYEALLIRIRTNNYDENGIWSKLQVRIIEVIKLHIQQNAKAMKRQLDLLLKFVEENLVTFSAYAESSTYKANHYKPYENKKCDTTFFFG